MIIFLYIDVVFQDTQTDRFVDEPWARRIDGRDVIVNRHRHYRLVTHTVGYPLKDIRGTEELLHATYDAFIGTSSEETCVKLLISILSYAGRSRERFSHSP